MRAGAWSTSRDIVAAVLSWQRARQIADSLSADHPDRLALRIAPRTRLCANGWRVGDWSSGTRFGELQQLCMEAGDKASLAMGMAGLLMELMFELVCAKRRSWHPKTWPCSSRSGIRH